MSALAMGGASGAVAASAHANCRRFRGTDPLITGQPRRSLAAALKVPDASAGIPDARWMRAMTFERLVHDETFASRIATKVSGDLELPRPASVTIVDAKSDVTQTLSLLEAARDRAVSANGATLIFALAVPFPGFDEVSATPVMPDFAVVTPGVTGDPTWVIAGDAKDYERVRSRIDDARMLKGYIQVAFGAEALDQWDALPEGLGVHKFGALAIPRNAFLQPTSVIEDLEDHREEVRMRLASRWEEAKALHWTGEPDSFVRHLEATFDPAHCASCPLFAFCRGELRESTNPLDFLTELGVAREMRPLVVDLVTTPDTATSNGAPDSVVAQIRASVSGRAVPTSQRRLDAAGEPGTVNVVVVKSDSAALGVYGLAIGHVGADHNHTWNQHVFDAPQSDTTRREIMSIIGLAVSRAMAVVDSIAGDSRPPVQLVVPDAPTADLLTSIADSLAGVEISRMRWEHDVLQGREPLTFDGEPATIPAPLSTEARLGVSFLLEEDRARAFVTRTPVINLRSALSRLVVAGGPAVNTGRLDYLMRWAMTAMGEPELDTRAFADELESTEHTPGARLSNKLSNKIHAALVGNKKVKPDAVRFEKLVRSALDYRIDTFDRALHALAGFEPSNLRDALRRVEGSAQEVWRRRYELQAFDLIRFGLTPPFWRNRLVASLEADNVFDLQLTALLNPHVAQERAADAGVRELTTATVVSVSPLVLDLDSRRFKDGNRLFLLHVNGDAWAERASVTVVTQITSVRVSGVVAGPIRATGEATPKRFEWDPSTDPGLSVGDSLVLANFDWYTDAVRTNSVSIKRPALDVTTSPQVTCSEEAYSADPDSHRWCCQPHLAREAAISDIMADKRKNGEMNPEVWPPVLDADAFDVSGAGAATAQSAAANAGPAPSDATLDDLE